MKQAFICSLLLCVLLPFSSTAQIGVADPVTGNAPITFYGKVVDENNQPIQGVQVHAEILVGYPYSWSTSITHPDPTNPVIFKMWKEGTKEPLICSAWHGKVKCDGALMTFDLLSGKLVKDGNLHITCTRTPLNVLPRENKQYDYNLQIDVLNGGIQPTKDEFTYLAPELGYSPSLNIGEKAGSTNWAGKVKQEFYIKTAEGHYGRLSLDWYAWQTSPTHFEWDCSINPSGSRNLER